MEPIVIVLILCLLCFCFLGSGLGIFLVVDSQSKKEDPPESDVPSTSNLTSDPTSLVSSEPPPPNTVTLNWQCSLNQTPYGLVSTNEPIGTSVSILESSALASCKSKYPGSTDTTLVTTDLKKDYSCKKNNEKYNWIQADSSKNSYRCLTDGNSECVEYATLEECKSESSNLYTSIMSQCKETDWGLFCSELYGIPKDSNWSSQWDLGECKLEGPDECPKGNNINGIPKKGIQRLLAECDNLKEFGGKDNCVPVTRPSKTQKCDHSTFCPVQLATTKNCGTIGNECVAPINGTVSCVSGKCKDTCNTGYELKGGKCINIKTINNCGKIGTKCTAPTNGTTSCKAGKCTSACNTGFELKNGICIKKCKLKEGKCIDSSIVNCSMCPPAPLNGNMSCENGECKPTCNTGFEMDTLGKCVDIKTSWNCGKIGNFCNIPMHTSSTGDSFQSGISTCKLVGSEYKCDVECWQQIQGKGSGAKFLKKGDQCVEIWGNKNNCGTLGNVCQDTESSFGSCQSGKCVNRWCKPGYSGEPCKAEPILPKDAVLPNSNSIGNAWLYARCNSHCEDPLGTRSIIIICKPGDPNGKTCKQVLDDKYGYKDLVYTISSSTGYLDGTERYTLSIPCKNDKCQQKTWWFSNTPETRLSSYSKIPIVKLDGTMDLIDISTILSIPVNQSLSLR